MRFALLFLAPLAVACHPIAPTYSDLESKVFLLSCATATCHSTEGNAGGLDLSRGKGYAALVGVAPHNDKARAQGLLRVTAGDVSKSFLVTKVTQDMHGSDLGDRMPPIGDALDEDAQWAIEQWIKDGAKNE